LKRRDKTKEEPEVPQRGDGKGEKAGQQKKKGFRSRKRGVGERDALTNRQKNVKMRAQEKAGGRTKGCERRAT